MDQESTSPLTSQTSAPAAARLPHKGRYLLVALGVLLLDQWSKWLVELHLPQHASHPVIDGFFNLSHVRNTGVAFGLFASHGGGESSVMLTGLGLLALLVVGSYFWLTGSQDRLLLVALSLVMGGAIGNLLDRVASGAVTDFLDVYVGTYHWPSFNVADSAITIGILLMAIDAFRHREASPGGEVDEEHSESPEQPAEG